MDHSTFIKLISAIIIFFTAYGAGYLALVYGNRGLTHQHPYGEAFASGIFLGAALFHMLPEAHQAFSASPSLPDYPYGNILCVASFILLFTMELMLKRWQKQSSFVPLLLLGILALHSFTEGSALGISQDWRNLSMIFLAIMAHKGTTSYALVKQLQRYKEKRTHSYLFIFSIMTPLGILLGNSLLQFTNTQSNMLITAYFYAIAAGSFFYISTSHGTIKYIIGNGHRPTHFKAFIMLCLGLGLMAIF